METKEEWIQFLRDNLDDMCRLVLRFHPKVAKEKPRDLKEGYMMHVTNSIRDRIQNRGGLLFDPPSALRKAAEESDGEGAWRILNDTWWGCPEDPIIQEERGFQDLCLLCSEGYLVVDYGQD